MNRKIMYNDAWAPCQCGHKGRMKVKQYLPGIADINIDQPDVIGQKLDDEKIIELFQELRQGMFQCPECNTRFNPLLKTEIERRQKLARELFKTT